MPVYPLETDIELLLWTAHEWKYRGLDTLPGYAHSGTADSTAIRCDQVEVRRRIREGCARESALSVVRVFVGLM